MMADIPLPDIFTQIWNYRLGGIQIVPIIIAIGAIYLIYVYLIKGRRNLPVFKRKDLPKETMRYNNHDYGNTGIMLNKVLKSGSVPLAYAMSYRLYNELPTSIKVKGKWIFQRPNANRPTDGVDNPFKIQGFRTRPLGFIGKLLSWLGFGITYYFVDNEFITENQNEVVINQNADHTIMNGIYVYGNKAKEIVENIAFKINRENELEEFINYIPKMNFLETNLSGIAATLREKAEIEKEKYRGQTDE